MRRFVTALLVLMFFITPALAAPALPNANAFIASQSDSQVDIIDDIDNSQVGQVLSGILLLIYKVGYGVAVAVLFCIAIKLMVAPPQKKAEAKAALTPYILGLLLLVAGVPIATMIIKMFITIF